MTATGWFKIPESLVAAVQFLTVIPIRGPERFEPVPMVAYFPVVGLLLGIGVALLDVIAAQLWPRPVASLLDVLFLVLLTGAFHLDGLGDTADGLYGRRPRETALSIMKDSRVGAMGLVAVVSILAVKWAGVASLDGHRTYLLILIPGLSRGAMLFGFLFLPYGRPDGGTGRSFFDRSLGAYDFRWVALTLALCLPAGRTGILLIGVFGALVAAALFFYHRRMGCITGDMLGALCETTEAGLFLMASAGGMG